MTSDAKVGLLLGLAFIFVIVFIINGLPSFNSKANNNELTTDMVGFNDVRLGLATNERKVNREVINVSPLIRPSKAEPVVEEVSLSAETEGVQLETTLPKITSAAHQIVKQTESNSFESEQTSTVISAETKSVKPVVVKKIKPKFYVICDGDSLSSIAQKFYGAEQGNKTANIMKIFNANRKFLKSANEIVVGQKLIIPPLNAPQAESETILGNSMLEKVQSIGKRHLESAKPSTEESKYYVVKEGDSLSKIAEQQLGSSSRYMEVAKLNSGTLQDEDYIAVGMRLKLPAK